MHLALILLQFAGLTNIARSNELVDQSAQAFAKGDYKKAADGYERIARDYNRADDAVLANLGHAHYRAGNLAAAAQAYQRLGQSKDPAMQSLGHAQLGVIADQQGNTEAATDQMKQALRADPNNQLARLNLERLLRKQPKLKQPKNDKEKKEQEKKEQEKKGQEQKDNKQQSGGDKQKQTGKQDSKSEADKPQNKPQPGQEGDKKDGKENQPQNQQGQKGPKSRNGQEQKPTGQDEKGKPNTDEKGKPEEDDAGTSASKEQLKKMQLPEDKARQLLDAMRAGEVQYLQQRRYRRKGGDEGKPGW